MVDVLDNEDYREKVDGGVFDLSFKDFYRVFYQIVNGIGLDIIKLVLDFNDIKEFLVFFGEVCINL